LSIIVSIDPGTTICGYAALELDDEGNITLLDSGYIQFDDGGGLLQRLNRLYNTLIDLVSRHSANYVMIEKTFKVDRGSLALAVAIKILREVVDILDDVELFQENAMRVRKHFGVGARTSEVAKEKVKQFVLKNFDLDDDLPNDVYDAILLGWYAIDAKL